MGRHTLKRQRRVKRTRIVLHQPHRTVRQPNRWAVKAACAAALLVCGVIAMFGSGNLTVAPLDPPEVIPAATDALVPWEPPVFMCGTPVSTVAPARRSTPEPTTTPDETGHKHGKGNAQ